MSHGSNGIAIHPTIRTKLKYMIIHCIKCGKPDHCRIEDGLCNPCYRRGMDSHIDELRARDFNLGVKRLNK